MFYRADLVEDAGFDGPPADWAEWRAMMEALTEGGHARYGALLPLNAEIEEKEAGTVRRHALHELVAVDLGVLDTPVGQPGR